MKTKLKSKRSGEAFIGVEVETKHRESWRRNGSKRRSPEAPKLKCESGRVRENELLFFLNVLFCF